MNLQPVADRLEAVESRLARIEGCLAESLRLREALQHEVESRRKLAEQAVYLLEQLGAARRQIQALQAQRS